MSFTTRRGASVKVWSGLILVGLLICAYNFLSAVSSRMLETHANSANSAPQQQSGASQSSQPASATSEPARPEQKEAQAFYLAKRIPEGTAAATSLPSFNESYLAARRRMCSMSGYSTALNQQMSSAPQTTGEGASGGWISLGPALTRRATMKEMADPCAPDGATVWPAPQFEFGATLFTHGLPYPGGATYLGATLDRGTLRGDAGGGRPVLPVLPVLEDAPGQVVIDANDPTVLYVAGPGLRVRKSSDGGRSFTEVNEGLADEGLLVAPLTADPNDNQRLWLGGRAIWRTNDGADRWAPVSAPVAGDPGARVSALAVAAANSSYVLAGTSVGAIYRSFNSFNLAPDEQWPSVRPRAGFVSSLTFDPHNPNIAYATYSTFGGAHVWRSSDAGASWASIDGDGATALPDMPVHSLVIDPTDSARLYVGTDLGVFVSLDGGQSWAVEQSGFGAAVVEALAVGPSEDGPALFAFTHGQRRGGFRAGCQHRRGDAHWHDHSGRPGVHHYPSRLGWRLFARSDRAGPDRQRQSEPGRLLVADAQLVSRRPLHAHR